MQYDRNDMDFHRGTFRVRGDTVEIIPMYEELAIRVEFFGDEIERIYTLHPLTGEVIRDETEMDVFPASHYVAGRSAWAGPSSASRTSSPSGSQVLESQTSWWRPSACGRAPSTTSK